MVIRVKNKYHLLMSTTMKKIYQIPETRTVNIKPAQMIAVSTKFDSTRTIEDSDIGVKAERHSDYNVWNDDWSR